MNLALFDFDGTITFEDSFLPFLRYSVDPARIALAKVVLLPFIIGYGLRIVPASPMRARLAKFGFRGMPMAKVREAGTGFARDMIPKIVRPKALERIRWHKAEGDAVVVVSGALDVYLKDWCRSLELDVICTELEVRDGILTGRYSRGDCSGEEKARRIREKYRPEEYPLVYAYGDTVEDRQMLELGNRKYFRWREISDFSELREKADRVDLDPLR